MFAARTRTIGLIVPDLFSTMTVALVRSVEDAVQHAGYTLLVAESRLDPRLEATHIANLLDRRVDGLLISPIDSVAAVERAVTPSTTPTVLVQLRKPRREFPSAFIDEAPAIDAAVAALVEAGHRQIALVHSSGRAWGGGHRVEDFRSALAARGINSAMDLDITFSGAADCYQVVLGLVGRRPRPTALVVGIHQFVPAALAAIRDAGLQMGRDLSLIVFGDSDWAQSLDPPLSCIVADQPEQAAAAVDLLLHVIAGKRSSARGVGTQSTFIPRGSLQPILAERPA